MSKAIVLFSGGVDSTICLALAIKKYGKDNVCAIGIDYGQKNIKEIECSKVIADYYGVNYVNLYLANILSSATNCSMLRSSKLDIPKISYDEQVKIKKKEENVSTNVPFRNGLMLCTCASYAIANGYDEIYYGIHLEEGVARELYPDCDEDFNMAMNLAIYVGSGKKVKIVAPLSGLLKKEVIKIGLDLKVPFDLTWTCYEEGDIPCGKCCACKDRIKGFKENNIEDPLVYEEEK